LTIFGQIRALGQVLPQQTIGVLVAAPLPWAMRIGKEHFPTCSDATCAGVALKPMVIAGHFSDSTGPCEIVILPAEASTLSTAPLAEAFVAAASAGIAVVAPDIGGAAAGAADVSTGLLGACEQPASSVAVKTSSNSFMMEFFE
jgi:hypothetical protein